MAVVSASVGLVLLASAAPVSSAAPSAVASAPVVPHNDRAAIFDAYGPGSNGGRATDLIARARSTLVREHYRVKLYQTATRHQGKRTIYGPGTATVANFVKMAGAGVIVFSTHGKDFSIAGRGRIPDYGNACHFAKGLFQSDERGDPLAPRPAVSCRQQPVLLVQNEPDVASELRAYAGYLRKGYSRSWIEPVAAIAPDHRDIFGILLTASGIRHFFAHRQVDLVLGSGCYSMSVAPDFNANSYFGYHSTTWDCEAFQDTEQLFTRLAGHSGVEARSTVAAYGLGGFADPNFQLDARKAIVLSPAVTAAYPSPGSTAGPGTSTRGFVTFDAAMDTTRTSGVLTASGCGATVADASWSNGGRYLGYQLIVPADAPEGTITLTVHHDKAVAAPGRLSNDQLDGNQDPSPDSGVEPSATDYQWTVACSAETVFKTVYTGTYNYSYGDSDRGDYTWTYTEIETIRPDPLVPSEYTDSEAYQIVSSGHQSTFGLDCTLNSGPSDTWSASETLTAGNDPGRTAPTASSPISFHWAINNPPGPAGSETCSDGTSASTLSFPWPVEGDWSSHGLTAAVRTMAAGPETTTVQYGQLPYTLPININIPSWTDSTGATGQLQLHGTVTFSREQ